MQEFGQRLREWPATLQNVRNHPLIPAWPIIARNTLAAARTALSYGRMNPGGLLRLVRSNVQAGKLLLEISDLGEVVYGDVRIFRVLGGVVLVVVLGAVELFHRDDLRHDGLRKNFGLVELLHVGLRDALLVGVGEENYGAVLRAGVGVLAIQLCGIVRDGEKHLQQ